MVTPPNSSNAPVPFGTPVHTRSSTTGYLGTKCPTRDKIFDVMSEEMAAFFLGPMPPRQFLSTFLPSSHPSSFQPGMFDALTQPSTETAKYQVFVSNCVPLRSLSGLKRSPQINIIQPHLKTLFIINTSHSPDKAKTGYHVSFAPDCTVYDQAHRGVTYTNSSISDIYIEFKNKAEEDAFLIDIPDKQFFVSKSSTLMNMPQGASTAGQITTYAALQLDSQYRTHVFSVLVVGDYARLIRWDRSGAIVTAPIYYQREPELVDFFTCYDQAEKPARGHDSSVRPATTAEATEAIVADREFFSSTRNLFVVTIPNHDCELKRSEYVIKPPVARPYTPPGRATRTSIAYDIQRRVVVFFKDSWRVAFNEVMREGEVYAILNKAKVPNIPRCSASGDVSDEVYHSTSTDRFANASWAIKRTHEFTPHRHHRLILDDVGEKLETFRRSKDMVSAIRAALIGAYPALLTSLDR